MAISSIAIIIIVLMSYCTLFIQVYLAVSKGKTFVAFKFKGQVDVCVYVPFLQTMYKEPWMASV